MNIFYRFCTTIVFAATIAVSTNAIAADVLCNPSSAPLLEHAKTERAQKQYGPAMADVESVLKTEPHNLRAIYARGLIELDSSGSKSGATRGELWKEGMRDLRAVADGIDEASKKNDTASVACLKAQDVTTIMNTYAYYLTIEGNNGLAEIYFLKSVDLAQRNLLNDDVKRKTYGNIGILYFRIGDYSKAKRYLALALKSGSKNPQIPIVLKAMQP